MADLRAANACSTVCALLERAEHAGGHVLHRHQDVDLEVGGLDLLVGRGRVEAVLDVVVLRGRVLLQLAAGDVVVGEQQAVRADEGAGAAVVQADADRRT